MGNTITRRELFRLRSSAATTQKKNIPYSGSRTNSGLTPYQTPLTEEDALHLLRRATFGATKEHVDLLKGKTASQASDLLVDAPPLPTSKPVNSYQNVFADIQGCAFGNSWVDHIPPAGWEQDPMLGTLEYYRSIYSLIPWWFGQMINQSPHVLEKLNLFWVNQFSTQEEENRQPNALWRYYNTIRTNALGNFRTLIKEITIDPNMLFFLNGHQNTASAPNENYARELQELFMLGQGAGYDDVEDVKAAARVLTGWRRKTETNGTYTSSFDPTRHATTNKQFSAFYNNKVITGKTGAAGAGETDELIDMILQNNECAKYICRRLYKWFIYYKIDAATEANVIVPLADIFRTNNYTIAPVIKALLTSEHFFDTINRGCMIKSPIDMYVAMVRELKIPLAAAPLDKQYAHWRHFYNRCEQSNQNIANPPDVSGWDAYNQEPVFYRTWITADTINKRLKTLNEYTQIGSGVNAEGVRIKADSIAYNKLFLSPGDPNAVIDNFTKYLLPQAITPDQRAAMKNIILKGQSTDSYWTSAWNRYVANPADTAAEKEVKDILDTLINYITALEEYQLC
jgi:hypothetical protein